MGRDITDEIKIYPLHIPAKTEKDFMTYEELPREKEEDLPPCKGCGRCCGPRPILSIAPNKLADYMLNEKVSDELRGMTIRNVKGYVWVCTPSCKHLDEKRECPLYQDTYRPKECKEFLRGCDACLMMAALNK